MGQPAARLRDCLTLPSRLRYLAWRLGVGGRSPLRVRVRTGEQLVFRPPPSSDVHVAMEVFAVGAYRPPAAAAGPPARRIIDLGANAGFSVVYFAARHPEARIEAYEPHPSQVEQLRTHVRLNNLGERVTVRPVAVSNRPVEGLFLTGTGATAQLGPAGGEGAVAVPVIDWFPEAEREPIDVLKIDIEGSEREIVLDPRFRRLDVRTVMIEWHALPDWGSAERDVKAVLAGMGLRLFDGPRGHFRGVDCGIVWGVR